MARFHRWGCVVFSLALGAATAAPAPAVDTKLLAQTHAQLDAGDAAGALHVLDDLLSSAPGDAEARFLRGLALVRLNRSAEAIDAFHALTLDHPKLPEPYNNLAVLYAKRGDLILARDTLENGLDQQPDYAPAQENLGDVYAALAAKAYNHALALNPSSSGVRAKLSLVSQVGNGPAAAPGTP